MLFADCGTTYTKILDTDSGSLQIIRTRDMLSGPERTFDAATGHLGKMRANFFRNELICLAVGAKKIIGSDTFCVIDVGGRDTKLVEFENGKPVRLDWNTSCGANTGFTLEIVGQYFGVDFSTLEPDEEYVNVTCGVFGMERTFDAIINGVDQKRAVARFVHGIARNVHRFVDRKKRFHFSGGLVENRCFMETLKIYADVIPLGRTLLLEGLRESYLDK